MSWVGHRRCILITSHVRLGVVSHRFESSRVSVALAATCFSGGHWLSWDAFPGQWYAALDEIAICGISLSGNHANVPRRPQANASATAARPGILRASRALSCHRSRCGSKNSQQYQVCQFQIPQPGRGRVIDEVRPCVPRRRSTRRYRSAHGDPKGGDNEHDGFQGRGRD